MRRPCGVLVIVLILVLAGGLLVTASVKVREAANRMKGLNNLKQTAMALHHYHDVNSKFPPAGMPNPDLSPESRLSWLIGIAPFYESNSLYVRMDWKQGWDAEENRYLALTVFPYLQFPGYAVPPPVNTLAPTHYVCIACLD